VQDLWNEILEVHFAVGADASTLYTLLATVAQTLAATLGFSIAFALLRFPAMEAEVERIDRMLARTKRLVSKDTAWEMLIARSAQDLYNSLSLAPGARAATLPELSELEEASAIAGPLLARWSVTRQLFEWTLLVNTMVILISMLLLPYVPWLVKAPNRVTWTCAFAVVGGALGLVLSVGFSRVLVRARKITKFDPPTG
jgi:hypothetical protein